MIEMSVTGNLDLIAAQLTAFERTQLPFAASIAINRCAELSRNALRAYMGFALDRPKPYTLNSIFIKKATKNLLIAKVFHSNIVSSYLRPMIEGTARGIKPFESILDNGIYIPSSSVQLDAYGNVRRSLIKKMVAAAKSPNSDPNGIFIVKPGSKSRLKPGVYKRTTRGRQTTIQALLIRVDSARYGKTYDMLGVVNRTVQSEFDKQFAAALDYATRSAK